MEPQRVEAVGGDIDGLMQRLKGQVRSAISEMSSSERGGNRGEREERREGRRGGLPKDRPQGGQREASRAKPLNMRAPPMQCWRLAIVKYVRDSVDS